MTYKPQAQIYHNHNRILEQIQQEINPEKYRKLHKSNKNNKLLDLI